MTAIKMELSPTVCLLKTEGGPEVSGSLAALYNLLSDDDI